MGRGKWLPVIHCIFSYLICFISQSVYLKSMQLNYANQPFSQYLHRSSALSTNKAVDWLASKRMFHLLWKIATIIGQSDHLKMLNTHFLIYFTNISQIESFVDSINLLSEDQKQLKVLKIININMARRKTYKKRSLKDNIKISAVT